MKLILASQSPRRRYLLEALGLDFEVIPSDFEEYFDESRPVTHIACELGLGKARAVAKNYPEAIVIGSDLIVSIDGRQIGKPATAVEAVQMLKSYRGRTHDLIASVAVVCKSRDYEKADFAKTTVRFDDMTDDEIDTYVATGTVYDKGGGYAIQHPMIRPHVTIESGELDTVIGMPTALVAKFLRDFNINVSPLSTGLSDIKSEKILFE